jgi:hypothetical protein
MTRPEDLEGKPETTANAMIREGKEQLAPLLREAPNMRRHKHAQAREYAKEIEDISMTTVPKFDRLAHALRRNFSVKQVP